MIPIRDIFGYAGYALEAVGVIVIIVGIAISATRGLARLRGPGAMAAYSYLRQNMARSIILGLEFLIAGDIIRTVIVDQTLTGAAVLALIVLIRVVLSLTLQFEIEGKWPWERGRG